MARGPTLSAPPARDRAAAARRAAWLRREIRRRDRLYHERARALGVRTLDERAFRRLVGR